MIRFGCVVVALVLPGQCAVSTQDRGALAIDESGGRYAFSLDGEADAVNRCATTACVVVATFPACLGVAHSSAAQGRAVWTWVEAATQADAGQAALDDCTDAGGPACEVLGALCVDAPAVEAALELDRAGRRRIQEGLRAAGYNAGGADGLFGPRTRTAIRQWQASRYAPATGYLNRDSVETLVGARGSGLEDAADRLTASFWRVTVG